MDKPDEFHDDNDKNSDVNLMVVPAGRKDRRQQQVNHRPPEHGSAIFYRHERQPHVVAECPQAKATDDHRHRTHQKPDADKIRRG
ncbi:hypothetical protein RS75_22620 [Rhizobium nepotum 39/7]|uniref:Uncharacterized protein n=1 Tax=Rhizobium nepotum 39/7 TaxID=1368418 RepID=A0ABR5CL50_9HYPH|nr:hypothetical protein RS75_22620 [Rhizobium nepotum 39/7]